MSSSSPEGTPRSGAPLPLLRSPRSPPVCAVAWPAAPRSERSPPSRPAPPSPSPAASSPERPRPPPAVIVAPRASRSRAVRACSSPKVRSNAPKDSSSRLSSTARRSSAVVAGSAPAASPGTVRASSPVSRPCGVPAPVASPASPLGRGGLGRSGIPDGALVPPGRPPGRPPGSPAEPPPDGVAQPASPARHRISATAREIVRESILGIPLVLRCGLTAPARRPGRNSATVRRGACKPCPPHAR